MEFSSNRNIDPLNIDQFFADEMLRHDPLVTWVEELMSELGNFIPEKNCSCHISPPCMDCEMYWSIRESMSNVEFYLSKIPRT